MSYAPSTQPEPIRQLLKRSLRLYREALPKVIIVACLLAVISFIPRLVALAVGQDIFAYVPQFSAEQLWLLLFELLGLVLFTILLWRIQCVMDGMHDSLKEDLFITFKKLPRIIGAAIVESAVILLLFFMTMGVFYFLREQNLLDTTNHFQLFLLFIPIFAQLLLNGFIFVLLMFYLPLILTENKHIFAALGKSAVLVWGNWWRTFITQSIPWLVYLITLVIIKFVFRIHIHIYFIKITQLSLFATVVHIIIFALFIPWSAATLLVQLKDLEIRKRLAALNASDAI